MSTKVGFDILENTIRKALMNAGLNEDKATLCARIHTQVQTEWKVMVQIEFHDSLIM